MLPVTVRTTRVSSVRVGPQRPTLTPGPPASRRSTTTSPTSGVSHGARRLLRRGVSVTPNPGVVVSTSGGPSHSGREGLPRS